MPEVALFDSQELMQKVQNYIKTLAANLQHGEVEKKTNTETVSSERSVHSVSVEEVRNKVVNTIILSDYEKTVRAKQALADAKAGNTCSTEQLCEKLDARFPWLCK